ncbi:MAG: hypothetical protein V1922_05555 [bacterium]
MKKCVQLCWSVTLYRHLFFLLLTFFVLLTYGYYFGTFDQASHIPYLKKTVDVSLFPHDHFFDLRSSHYSYFWLFFIPFYKIRLLEPVMFLVHAFSTYLTFWAIWKLAKTLFHNPLTTFLATVASIFPHIGFSGFPLFEFSMLNRTVMLPFELIAFRYYLKKNYVATFLILGILYNFHALSVHFVLAMMGTDMLITLIKKREIKAFYAVPLFFITALPVLIWKFSHSGTPINLQWEWFRLLDMSTFFHLFNFVSFTNPVVTILTAGGVSALILFFIAKKYIPKNKVNETVTHFIYGGILVLFAQLIATSFFPITIIIQAQVVRIGTFLTLFAYLYTSHMVSTCYKSRSHFFSFVTSLFLSFSPLFFLTSLLFWRTTQVRLLRVLMIGIIITFCAILVFLFSLNVFRPGIHIWPEKTAFYDVQVWAKTQTPRTARFLTPPAKWWLYDVEWRVISERSTISTLSELLEGAFDPSYISYWKPRFEDVAPGAIKQFKGDYLANLKLTDKAYYNRSTAEFIALGKKYDVSYIVVDKHYIYNLPIAYQNAEYTVYSLTTHQAVE